MSGDSNGKKPDGKGRAKIPSVLLALTGIAVVAIQTYVFISFDQFKDSYGPFTLYNGVAIASGAVSCLTGFIGFCCTSSKRSSSGFCFSALVGVLAAICSAGSAALTAIESSKIHSDDIDHPCALSAANDQTINCQLWFDLEVAVAALSVLSFILSVTLCIVIMAGSSKSKKKMQRSNVERPVEMVREMEHIPAAQPVVVIMPVIVEEVYKEMEVVEPEPEEPEESEESEPETNTIAGRQPYIEQLRMLSREELERRLGEHMQHQFLEELRTELNRRNLIPINGRSGSSSSSSVRSASKVPVAPRPDYYQEETL
ncbi:hypothetical protein DAPPUDRAFT_109931 [Daphnia pulex]|uniref:Uncharacterized protein n=1 Tax=Daphnia pulex TaxID=6669 RepID=E9H4M5_DAPPU|nr:hypothetical protein DAPPUDRAFT_109931 [Daphnia pulex]|eukprot:EFX73170.1 hypothetical protein DAPPUDRAFT_109931 [Daphnia pulex]